MTRDVRAEIASDYLTFAERMALERLDDPAPCMRSIASIGRTLAIGPDLAEQLVTSAKRKRAAGAPSGTASPRRARRMGHNLTRWNALVIAEYDRRLRLREAEPQPPTPPAPHLT